MLLRILLIAVLALPLSGAAQEQKDAEQGRSTSAQQAAKGLFKVEYQVVELEDGKRMDSHSYILLGSVNDTARLRIGSRVPVRTGGAVPEHWQYMDVGMNIDARITEPAEDAARVNTTIDLSSLVMTAGVSDSSKLPTQPVLRNLHASDLSTLSFGKQATLFHLDEPNSKRAFQVFCTVTKLR